MIDHSKEMTEIYAGRVNFAYWARKHCNLVNSLAIELYSVHNVEIFAGKNYLIANMAPGCHSNLGPQNY